MPRGSVQTQEKILRWDWTNMNSASEFMHDGWIDLCGIRIVCHRFVYLWESVLRGLVPQWGCDHWGCAPLGLRIPGIL